MDETNVAVRGRALQPNIEISDIGIEGMTCDNCVRTIERALRGKRGIRDVKVDRERARVTVAFETKTTNIPEIHDTLLKAGYKPTSREAE